MITEIQKYDSGLGIENHNKLAAEFNPVVENMPELISIAKNIQIRDSEDVKSMKQARQTRLALREIRINVEKTRKTLKEDSKRTGQAIDGMANVLKFLIEPVENDLQEKEEFIRIQEQRRTEKLSQEREAILAEFEVDTDCFELGHMKAEAFEHLRKASEAGYKAKKQAELDEITRQQNEAATRAAEELKRQKELEQYREELEEANKKQLALEKKLKAEKDKKDAAIEKERKAKQQAQDKLLAMQKAEDDRKKAEAAKKLADELEKKRLEAEKIQKEKEAEEKKLQASDMDKLLALRAELFMLELPEVKSKIAKHAIADVTMLLEEIQERLGNAANKLEG